METKGYDHQVTFLRGRKKSPSQLMPRVRQVVSLFENVAPGHSLGGSQRRASRLLLGRVHLPLLPREIAEPREADVRVNVIGERESDHESGGFESGASSRINGRPVPYGRESRSH